MIKFFTQLSIALFFSFTALQANAQVVNNQSFDGATFVPVGWAEAGSYPGSLTRVVTGIYPTQTPHSGAGELEWNSFSIGSGTEDLITPMFDLSGRGANTPTISFWFYRDVSSYNT